MTLAINFPDVLGYITRGERFHFDNIQVAATALPMTVKAGKIFRLVVLIQNMIDSPVTLMISLALPADSAGKKGKFSANTMRLEVGLQPAEVGLVLLPVGSMGDTTSGAVKFAINISDVKASRRGAAIRAPEGGSALYADGLSPDKRKLFDNFAKQSYVGGKKGLFTSTITLTPTVNFQQSGMTEQNTIKAEYRSIWLPADFRENPVILLERFKTPLTQSVLPSLERSQILAPLVKQTGTRFKQAGYELTEIEAKLIGRAMTNVLEYACTGRLAYGVSYPPRTEYQVLPLIKPVSLGKKVDIKLHWLIALLNAMSQDINVIKTAWKLTLQNWFYDALLRDTLTWGFDMVEQSTGIDLGTPEELEEHAMQRFEKFQNALNGVPDAEKLTIEDIYLPLVMAGLAVYDKVAPADESIDTLQPALRGMLRRRLDERTDENAPLFELVATMLTNITGDQSIINAVKSRASSNSRTYQIPHSKRKTRERDIKAIREFFKQPVSDLRVYDPYLLDYERLYNRLGAYVELAHEKGALKSVYVETRNAKTNDNDGQEQTQAITALENRFPTVAFDIRYPQRLEHDRWVEITRTDGTKSRLIIGRGLDFIRSDGSVKSTYLVIEDL